MSHSLPKLRFAYDALEPYLDARTMEIHHSKHHQGYVGKLNKALEGHPVFSAMSLDELLQSLDRIPEDTRQSVRNNGGGHANHSLFWTVMGPQCGGEPQGALAKDMDSAFSNFKQFQQQFTAAALSRFGSGWTWLTLDENHKLAIESTPNQDSPLIDNRRPILGLDVWEHAYYLKYQNRRADYIDAWWNVVNWSSVAKLHADQTLPLESTPG
jgi:Fe-Mn family superoxide dismutase